MIGADDSILGHRVVGLTIAESGTLGFLHIHTHTHTQGEIMGVLAGLTGETQGTGGMGRHLSHLTRAHALNGLHVVRSFSTNPNKHPH